MIVLLLIIAVPAQTETSGSGAPLLQDQSKEEGWHLQGEPVITKDKEIDLPPCYTGRTVTVSNGEGHGSQTYSTECFKEGSGTYSSDVIWTPPPAYMKPGSTISFSMTFTSPDENPTSGLIKAAGETIVEGDSRNPGGRSTATYNVPAGSPGDELVVYANFVMISGLHGYVDYKYEYQGAGAEENEADAGKSGQSDISSKTYCCKGSCNYKRWWSEPKSEKGSDELLKTMADSGVRFSGLTGQVDIRPDADEYAWRGAGLKSIINVDDHVRTGEESRAILSFADMTTFELRPESEVIIDTPPEKDSKISLVCGKFWTNFRKMFKDGSMEIQMSQAVAGIKGTTIVCEETGDSSALKVLDGTASFKSRATGEEILVDAGEMVTATESGLSRLQSFDVEAENASFGAYAPAIEAVEPKESKMIYNSWNLGTVDNAPTCSPFFTISEPQMITYIDTYHWNYGQGEPGGTIGLREGDGTVHGPWQVESSLDGGEVPRGYWIAHPNEIIPAGTYTIEDSDPGTWSQNSESPCGLAKVEGYPVESPASQNGDIPAADIKETASGASTKGTSSHPPALAGTADTGADVSQGRGMNKPASSTDLISIVKEKLSDSGTHPPGTEKTISSPAMEGSATAKPEQTLIEDGAYPAPSDRSVEIRGQAATGNFEWTAQNFAGFYYDPDNDVGTEALTATLTDGKLSGSQPLGLYYQTTAKKQDFAFRDWGSYLVLGFLGERHLAGYAESDSEIGYLFGEKNALAKGQLLKILLDDDTETTITTDTNLQLEDGYELSIKSIDIEGNVVDLELTRDGTVVDSGKVSPSKDGATIADQTYIYKKDNGDMKDMVVIAVHFKNAFRGADQDLATVDGLWQLSETPVYVSQGAEYDKMTVQSVTDDAIIMPGMAIKTADADELRYYIYREIIEPGEFEIRSTVETADYAAWTASEFAGFYYDLNKDIETEMLAATITDGKLAEPDGIRYTTEAIASDFKFKDWGSYQVMGFLGEKCFAGYVDGSDSGKAYLFEKSSNKSALANGQLCKVLVDDDSEKTITSNTPLMLEEGYRLELKAVNPDDGRAYANLLKGDKLVKDYMFQPSKDEATLSDKTCFFRDPSLGLVTIAVHFKNVFAGSDQNLATIDGIWQISESPISVAKGTSFDKLTVSEVTDRSLVMNNIDQTIALSRDKNIALAGDMRIRTADTDFLRYYLVKEESPSDLSRVEGYAAASEDVSPATGSNRMASEVEPNLEEAVSTPYITSASNSLDELSYSDDFSDTNSGWSRASNSPDLDAMGYDDGRYHIIRKKPGQSWSYPPDSPIFRDFAVEVEANQEEGPDNNQYGLVLRRDASGNYYCFQISGAGNYRFDVNLNGNWREIVPDTWSSKINTGRDENVLRVVCSGESFIFYANGAKIGEAQDSSITSGRVGLVAGSLDDQRLHISFDNLKVWAL